MEIVNNLAFKLDKEAIAKKMHISAASPMAQYLDDVLDDACAQIKPKAAFKIAYIEDKTHDTLRMDNVLFKSRVLLVNLDKVERAFPFVVTCGQEYDQLHQAYKNDVMKTYILNEVANALLRGARETLFDNLQKRYGLGITSKMSPGSLGDWPIEQQQHLFPIFGDGAIKKGIGVSLTPSYLMLPVKSVSGIMFESQKSFHNCQLCPRDECPSRRTPYDEATLKLYE